MHEERLPARGQPGVCVDSVISGGADTADAKLEIMEACGIRTTRNPSEMGKLLKEVL
mgnify:CR=1 FL=1